MEAVGVGVGGVGRGTAITVDAEEEAGAAEEADGRTDAAAASEDGRIDAAAEAAVAVRDGERSRSDLVYRSKSNATTRAARDSAFNSVQFSSTRASPPRRGVSVPPARSTAGTFGDC